jgi:cytochrome c oxidase cbb3-type subunit III
MSKAFLRCGLCVVLYSKCLAAQSPAIAASDAGPKTFASTCATCHGLDGKGGEHAPNIATEPRLQRAPDAAILKIIRNGIPAAGMPAFGSSLNESQLQAVLNYLRVLQGTGNQSSVPIGDAESGRALFYGKAGCATCHIVDGKGGFWAADLSGYGSAHPNTAVREAIVEPNKNFDARKGLVTVRGRDGKSVTGLVRNEDNFSIQLQSSDGAFHSFDKSKLAELQRSTQSPMPGDYANRLSSAEIDDLIGFLAQSKGRTQAEPDDDQ